jgi:hypothetical protein
MRGKAAGVSGGVESARGRCFLRRRRAVGQEAVCLAALAHLFQSDDDPIVPCPARLSTAAWAQTSGNAIRVAAFTDSVTVSAAALLLNPERGVSSNVLPSEIPVSGAVARQPPGNGLLDQGAELGGITGTGTSPSPRPASEDRASFMRPGMRPGRRPGRRPGCTGGGRLRPRTGSSRKSASPASASLATTCRRSGLIWPPRIQHII